MKTSDQGHAIPKGNLAACPDHRIVALAGDPCPSCVTGIEARGDDVLRDVKPVELRFRIEPDTMIELILLMDEYLSDRSEGPLWIAIAELERDDLPAGYTPQERWFNVIRYRYGSMEKTLLTEGSAKETIDTFRSNGYGDE